MSCSYGNDAAVARRIYEPPVDRTEWVETPERIHISPELLRDKDAREFIEGTYRITDEWCSEKLAIHAVRLDA